MAQPARTNGAGRPRDATIEARVLDAAIRQFGQRGWPGLSIDRIAAATGVGKASIYLRWDCKEDLLLAALATHVPRAEDFNEGSLEKDLRLVIAKLLDLFHGEFRSALDRFNADRDVPPALRERFREFQHAQIQSWRGVIRRAIERGELPDDTPVTFLLDVLHGSVWSHVTALPVPSGERRTKSDRAFTEHLIHLILAGFQTRGL